MFTQYTRWTHWSPNTWATLATELQPLRNYLLRMRNLSEPSELSEKISFKEFCFGSDVIWRVGSGLIWRGVRSQVEKRVFDFLQTFLFCSDASVPVWSEQVCDNLNGTKQRMLLRQDCSLKMSLNRLPNDIPWNRDKACCWEGIKASNLLHCTTKFRKLRF